MFKYFGIIAIKKRKTIRINLYNYKLYADQEGDNNKKLRNSMVFM